MMDTGFLTGVAFVALAVLCLSFALVGDTSPRVARDRRQPRAASSEQSLLVVIYRSFVGLVERVLASRGWVPFRATELELADVRMSAAQVVTLVLAGAAGGVAVGVVVAQSIWVGLAIGGFFPALAKMILHIRTARRQRQFNKQLDGTLQMMASSLRAGQSFPQALDSCARDADSPMRDELARIVNEHRIGRDITEAMQDAATRMKCDDLVWLSEAVEITRESGGNLSEIVDRVAETMRERSEIREKVHAYASEGRMTSYILMSLPIFVGVAYSFITPGYLDPLFTTGLGNVLLAGSAVMFAISFFWMRAIVNVRF